MAIKIPVEKLHSMFFNEGKTVSAIADAFKVDKSYISRILKREFLSEYREEKAKRSHMSKDGKVYDLYFIGGKSVIEVADIVGKSQPYVTKILQLYPEYQKEKAKRKFKNKKKQSSSESLDKDKIIYNLYFVEGKSVIEITDIIGKSQPYVTKALQSYPEYETEKERRKALNREKRATPENCDEFHYKYRERPLMPNETIGILSFIKFNRQSYITDKKGKLFFDESRGKKPFDIPKTYKPVIW